MADAFPNRHAAWLRRETVGSLSDWGELWLPAQELPDYDAWVRVFERAGRDASGDSVLFCMTSGLLSEVLYAAGAVESELRRLETLLAEAQTWANTWVPDTFVSDEESPAYVSPEPLAEAYYAFTNLLTWTRTVVERTDRRAVPSREGRSGLLPALAPGSLHDRVLRALDQLKAEAPDVRHLANYALHAGAVSGISTPKAQVVQGGRLLVPVPDQVVAPLTTWHEFTFSDGRDMLTVARHVMSAVERFVESVLTGFESARPERAGPLPSFPDSAR